VSLPAGYQLSAAEIQLLTQQLQQQAQQVQLFIIIIIIIIYFVSYRHKFISHTVPSDG